MLLYFGKQYSESRTGHRLARVECDRCGCEYFYQLSRIGTGTGTAPYFIGTGRAQRAAARRASRDLQRRLERETELVPCPKCSWISDQLADAYRRTRYKFLGKVAFYIWLTTTVAVVALLPLLGFGPDALLPVALVLSGLVLVAGGVLGVRAVLRSRIRPNANYPEARRFCPGRRQRFLAMRPQGTSCRLSRRPHLSRRPASGATFNSGDINCHWSAAIA
jgi:hypothetical protein